MYSNIKEIVGIVCNDLGGIWFFEVVKKKF